jgi:hypothetical protein
LVESSVASTDVRMVAEMVEKMAVRMVEWKADHTAE